MSTDCGNVESVPKAPFISYSRISHFGHECPKLNFVLISRLTAKCATQKLKRTYATLVYGHVDILWKYQGAKIKILIFHDLSLIVSL